MELLNVRTTTAITVQYRLGVQIKLITKMQKRISLSKKITSKNDFKDFFRSLRVNYPYSVANYGTSNDGYAYSCGCQHDCCGHLTAYSYNDIQFKRKGRVLYAIITHSYDYNY